MSTDQGTIVEVSTSTLGDELAADAPAGALTLTLVDTADFADDGSLSIGAEVIDYTAVDDDAATMTLETPLANAYTASERVLLYPETLVKTAQVMIGTADEAVDADVPHTLWDRLADGIRDPGAGEVVDVELVGTDYVVTNVVSSPTIDGSYIDPDTLPASGDLTQLQADLDALENDLHGPGGVDEQLTGLNTDLHGVGGLDEQLAATNTELDAVLPITSDKLVDDAVTAAKIAAAAVGAAEIADGAVANAKLVDGAVTTAKVAAGAITETTISDDAITTPKIATGAVTAAEVAAGAIVAGKIAAGAVTATELSAGAVTAGKVAAGAISATELAAGAVVAGKIAANAVTAGELAANAVTAGKIAANAVTANTIAAGAVTTGKLSAGAVTANEVAAGAITTTKLGAGAVTANEVAAGAITTAKLAAGAVTANELTAGAVTADKIAAGAITADKLSATAIDGKTITGALIRTAAAGRRIQVGGNSYVNQLMFYSGLETGTVAQQDAKAGALLVDGTDYGLPGAPVLNTHVILTAPDALNVVGPQLRMEALDDLSQSWVQLNDTDQISISTRAGYAGAPTFDAYQFDAVVKSLTLAWGAKVTGVDYGYFDQNTDTNGRIQIGHSLGNTPGLVLAFSHSASGTGYVELFSKGSTSFQLTCRGPSGTVNPGGTRRTGHWLAFR